MSREEIGQYGGHTDRMLRECYPRSPEVDAGRHDTARKQASLTEALAAHVRAALRTVLPRDMAFELTATQRRGKLRLDFRSIVHEDGWKDTSGGR